MKLFKSLPLLTIAFVLAASPAARADNIEFHIDIGT